MVLLTRTLVYLLFITAPFVFLNLMGLNFVLFDIVLILLLCVTLLSNKKIKVGDKTIYFLILAFFVVALWPIYRSEITGSFLTGYVQFLFIFIVLFPLLNTHLSTRIANNAIRYMLIVWSVFLALNLLLILNTDYYHGGRFIGLYSSPLNKALVTSLMLPLYLGFIGEEKYTSVKTLFVFGIVLSVFFITITGSRAVILSLFIGIVIYSFFKFRIKKFFAVMLLMGIIVIPMVFVSTYILQIERNVFQRITTQENISGRFHDYKLSSPEGMGDLFVGAGVNRGGEYIQEKGGVNRPHNIFLSVFVETGIFGLLLFIGIIVTIFWQGLFRSVLFKLKRKNIHFIQISILISGLIIVLAQQFSPVSFHRIYWLILALCFWVSSNKFMIGIKLNSDSNYARLNEQK